MLTGKADRSCSKILVSDPCCDGFLCSGGWKLCPNPLMSRIKMSDAAKSGPDERSRNRQRSTQKARDDDDDDKTKKRRCDGNVRKEIDASHISQSESIPIPVLPQPPAYFGGVVQNNHNMCQSGVLIIVHTRYYLLTLSSHEQSILGGPRQ